MGIAYVTMLLLIVLTWRKIPDQSEQPSDTAITVVIAARNEEATIGACLDSIIPQLRPQDAIIVIDDHSDDATAQQVSERSCVKLLQLQDHLQGKKAALRYAAQHVETDWITLTDADCQADPNWLSSIRSAAHPDVDIVAGLIKFRGDNSLLQRFQALDMAGMMVLQGAGTVSGSLALANGANLSVRTSAFRAAQDHMVEQRASGDDVFMLQHIQSQGGRIAFLKSKQAIITTSAESTWSTFWQQRFRWASKSYSYTHRATTLMTFFTGAYCLLLLISPFSIFVFQELSFLDFAWLWMTKAAADSLLIRTGTRFLGIKEPRFIGLVFMSLFHAVYVVVIGLLGPFVTYKWKGRKTK